MPTVETIPTGSARDAWVPLLELADEPAPVRAALQQGALHGVRDADGQPCAAVLVLDRGDSTAELRAVAVAATEQGRGLGSWLVGYVCDVLRAASVTRVIVATASSGLRQLGFYQRLGFRLTHIDRDFFIPERGYPPDLSENGIPSRDAVWMDQTL